MDLAALPKDWVVTSGQFTQKTHTSVYSAIDPTNPENSLRGKVVVVTGASRGLGADSIAPAFVRAGVKAIILIATNASKLFEVERELKKLNPGLETLALRADISSSEQVSRVWCEINAKFSKVHILVNNAGVDSTDHEKKIHEQDPDIFAKNFEVNVKGTHIVSQQFISASLHWASATDKAAIITISSSSAWGVFPFLAAYSMSKAANIQYTTLLAAAYPESILAIAVNPGLNDTEIIPEMLRSVGFNYNDPSIAGAFVVWLSADPSRSQFLNGRALTVEWDVEELIARKEEILDQNLLTLQLHATLGLEQFVH